MTIQISVAAGTADAVGGERLGTGVEVVGATVGRSREVWDAYAEFRRTSPPGCNFCREHEQTVVETTSSMRVIRNLFPYAIWDSCHVEDHLMVIPVRHLLSIAEYDGLEAREFLLLISRYEATGYSVYSRSPHATARSVAHAHTHLIKTRPLR